MVETLLVRANHPEKLPALSSQSALPPLDSREDEALGRSLSTLRSVMQSMVSKLEDKISSNEKVFRCANCYLAVFF